MKLRTYLILSLMLLSLGLLAVGPASAQDPTDEPTDEATEEATEEETEEEADVDPDAEAEEDDAEEDDAEEDDAEEDDAPVGAPDTGFGGASTSTVLVAGLLAFAALFGVVAYRRAQLS